MPTMNLCEYCGKDIDYHSRADSRFCDDQCRAAHHNDRRKVQRAQQRINDALDILAEIVAKNNTNSSAALAVLAGIEAEVRHVQTALFWLCDECGQTAYARPGPDEKCSFCGESAWTARIRKTAPS